MVTSPVYGCIPFLPIFAYVSYRSRDKRKFNNINECDRYGVRSVMIWGGQNGPGCAEQHPKRYSEHVITPVA